MSATPGYGRQSEGPQHGPGEAGKERSTTITKALSVPAILMELSVVDNLDKLVAPCLNRPVGRPPKHGIQVKIVDL